MDEVHYLQNPYRGAVWEEVIIHLAPEVDLVCLSATVSNAEEFADWIETVRGETQAVIEERRPVRLQHLYLVGDRHSEDVSILPTFVELEGPDGLVEHRPNPEAARSFVRFVLSERGRTILEQSGFVLPARAEIKGDTVEAGRWTR